MLAIGSLEAFLCTPAEALPCISSDEEAWLFALEVHRVLCALDCCYAAASPMTTSRLLVFPGCCVLSFPPLSRRHQRQPFLLVSSSQRTTTCSWHCWTAHLQRTSTGWWRGSSRRDPEAPRAAPPLPQEKPASQPAAAATARQKSGSGPCLLPLPHYLSQTHSAGWLPVPLLTTAAGSVRRPQRHWRRLAEHAEQSMSTTYSLQQWIRQQRCRSPSRPSPAGRRGRAAPQDPLSPLAPHAAQPRCLTKGSRGCPTATWARAP